MATQFRADRMFNEFFNTLDQKLEKPTKNHLKNVYTCLAICMLAAALGGYVHVVTGILQGNILTSLIAIGLLIALSATPFDASNQKLRLGLLTGFAFFTGLGLGPLMDAVIELNPSIVPTAFLATCVIFACFTLSALFSDQRKYLYLGGILMSGLSYMLLLSLANLFFRSNMLFQVNLYAGLFIMCGFVLYDTQLIIAKFRGGDRDYVWHCVSLFMDFISIFRKLLVILAQKEGNKKRRD